ncbi:uncharacterized protein F5891DRAFT_156227 [Suillus fuscotomentosus]|uniref:Secreted protein n=1 Tax=Suillus fuscotomentosus TaxID=1912939 RepID=A0AAD4HD47_9AGAM|nr:uncharacterized protein F5891DRAFT_280361 [Suillus fuscotomentosus]XP_041217322.1 uncharacterized protein F5891DRAFT_156227 [Suillus fuscotomentosus]KAG1886881.1 hypothetical protein F5891DRAFT_280361 [Suillus fuscotomentosus]KAG1889003.1 hypothetical protein F5891DRAFT_156227 [Suillus fuscotomentosus]
MAQRPRVTHRPLLRTLEMLLEMLLVQSVYPCTSVAEWITGMCQTAGRLKMNIVICQAQIKRTDLVQANGLQM